MPAQSAANSVKNIPKSWLLWFVWGILKIIEVTPAKFAAIATNSYAINFSPLTMYPTILTQKGEVCMIIWFWLKGIKLRETQTARKQS